ncbi:MAG TPA: hypothetical protein PLR51_03780, partial [Methanomassiliicoccales archaeon]|nr:hypothetical protein [Methanomassiliicoccales archaeon]
MAGKDDDERYEHRNGFPPVVGKAPLILILGTIPSLESALKEEYYGNPMNQFWMLVYGIYYDLPLDSRSKRRCPLDKYDKKIDFLKSQRIAIWDVFRECDII